MLHRACILIVEDETLIALELSGIVEDGGGRVIGPCGSIDEAMHVLDNFNGLDAAILDFRLGDGVVTPIAHRLLDARVPIVLHTASPVPAELLDRMPGVAVCSKPSLPWAVLAALEALLDGELDWTPKPEPTFRAFLDDGGKDICSGQRSQRL